MKQFACVNCLKAMPICLDNSSKAGVVCVYCHAKQLVKRDRHGKFKIEEAELAEDVCLDINALRKKYT